MTWWQVGLLSFLGSWNSTRHCRERHGQSHSPAAERCNDAAPHGNAQTRLQDWVSLLRNHQRWKGNIRLCTSMQWIHVMSKQELPWNIHSSRGMACWAAVAWAVLSFFDRNYVIFGDNKSGGSTATGGHFVAFLLSQQCSFYISTALWAPEQGTACLLFRKEIRV